MENQITKLRALRLPQVIDKTGISRGQIYRMIKAGDFPASYGLVESGCIQAWSEAEIDAWLESKFADHRKTGNPPPEPIDQRRHNGGPPPDDTVKPTYLPEKKFGKSDGGARHEPL